MRIGIIGAGIAGLTLARRLVAAGHEPVVLDKGRGVGGRASTRRGEAAPFDHGAQYFTARDPAFRAFLEAHVPAASRAVWPGRFAVLDGGRLGPEPRDEPRLVGVPGMGAIARGLAAGIEVRPGTKVDRLEGSPGSWTLVDAESRAHGPFDWVVATAPPAQSSALLAGHSPIAAEAGRVAMRPCFALMIVPPGGATLPADGIRCVHPVLGWAAVDGSKPGRPVPNALVIHSSADWAEAHLVDDLASVGLALAGAAGEAFGVDLGDPPPGSVHRWLHARPREPLGRPCLVDPAARLAAAGDWCLAAKVEGAFLSGDGCAGALLARRPGLNAGG